MIGSSVAPYTVTSAIVVIVVAVIPIWRIRIVRIIGVGITAAKITVIRAVPPTNIHRAIPIIPAPIEVRVVPIRIVPIIRYTPIGVIKIIIYRCGRVFPSRVTLAVGACCILGCLFGGETIRYRTVLVYIGEGFRCRLVVL